MQLFKTWKLFSLTLLWSPWMTKESILSFSVVLINPATVLKTNKKNWLKSLNNCNSFSVTNMINTLFEQVHLYNSENVWKCCIFPVKQCVHEFKRNTAQHLDKEFSVLEELIVEPLIFLWEDYRWFFRVLCSTGTRYGGWWRVKKSNAITSWSWERQCKTCQESY